MVRHGPQTAEFGLWLTNYLAKYPVYVIHYDHGDAQAESNVAEPKGFVNGGGVSNLNRLGGVDVLVADSDNNIILLVEIEERAVAPKKLLGDVFAILMCNRFAAKVDSGQQYFNITPQTRLIVAGVLPAKGVRLQRINEVIAPRLREFSSPHDSVSSENVELIFAERIETSLEVLKERMDKMLSV